MAAKALTPTGRAVAGATASVATSAFLFPASTAAAAAAASVATPMPLVATAVSMTSAADAALGNPFTPGRIAQFDLTKTPPVVVDIYNYNDPTYMVGATWMDVTGLIPPVVPGCTYSGGVWTYPKVPEDMVAVVRAAIATNNAYLTSSQNAGLQRAQLAALTQQWTRWMLRRTGGI